MSAANAKTSLGATIGMGTVSGTYTTLTEVLSITPPKIQRGTMDASDLATTGGMELLAEGLYSLTPVAVQVHYVAGSTQDDLLVAAATDGGIRYFEIKAKAASGTEDIEFAGYVTEYGPDELTIGGKQTASITIQPSGDWAQAAS